MWDCPNCPCRGIIIGHCPSCGLTKEDAEEMAKITVGGGPSDARGEVPEPEGVPEPPTKSSTKAEWVEYAQGRGMSQAQAEGMTKQELIDTYVSGEEESSAGSSSLTSGDSPDKNGETNTTSLQSPAPDAENLSGREPGPEPDDSSAGPTAGSTRATTSGRQNPQDSSAEGQVPKRGGGRSG